MLTVWLARVTLRWCPPEGERLKDYLKPMYLRQSRWQWMSSAVNLQVVHFSFPLSLIRQREMAKLKVLWRTWTWWRIFLSLYELERLPYESSSQIVLLLLTNFSVEIIAIMTKTFKERIFFNSSFVTQCPYYRRKDINHMIATGAPSLTVESKHLLFDKRSHVKCEFANTKIESLTTFANCCGCFLCRSHISTWLCLMI